MPPWLRKLFLNTWVAGIPTSLRAQLQSCFFQHPRGGFMTGWSMTTSPSEWPRKPRNHKLSWERWRVMWTQFLKWRDHDPPPWDPEGHACLKALSSCKSRGISPRLIPGRGFWRYEPGAERLTWRWPGSKNSFHPPVHRGEGQRVCVI